jgi:hypothetical protein
MPFFERDKNLTLSLLYIQLKVLPLIKEVLYSSKRASGICRSKTACSEGSETSWFCKPYHAPEQSAGYTIKEGDALLSKPKNAQHIPLLLLLLTATELSLGGSRPCTSTDKTNKNIQKRNNTKNRIQKIQNTVNPSTHITKTHTLKNKLKQPEYNIHPNEIVIWAYLYC